MIAITNPKHKVKKYARTSNKFSSRSSSGTTGEGEIIQKQQTMTHALDTVKHAARYGKADNTRRQQKYKNKRK